jgi:serine/threonine protein kinase
MEALAGRGGMGEVWRATDTRLDRTVAIKLLRLDLADSEESRQRFKREARALTTLDVPGTARIRDYGEEVLDGEDVAYLVLEYIEGTTLSRMLSMRGPLEAPRLLPILEQVAATLDAAHRNGIIHRDIKPSNIMVGADGKATLLDFGIAHSLGGTQLTQSGQIMGTLSYASPEQLNGRPLSPESDVYSLGIVAYECLAGEPPFKGEPLAIFNGHQRQQPPEPPSGTPKAMARSITRALSKTPEERFVSASDFVAACGGTSSEMTPTSVRLSPTTKRAFTLTAALALVAAIVATLVILAPWAADEGSLSASGPKDKTHHPWIPPGLDSGTLVDSQDGVFYKVADNGDVYWYRHLGFGSGEVKWDKRSGKRIGGDWKGRRVVAGCNGTLYAVNKAGDLYWYRHTDPKGGRDTWSKHSGTLLRHDFKGYKIVSATSVAVFYAIDSDGNLRWFLHTWPDEGKAIEWNTYEGKVTRTDWDAKHVRLASGGGELIYTVDPHGDIEWHVHGDQGGGSNNWSEEPVGHGFGKYASIISSAGGIVYARTKDGKLYWYRHLGFGNGEATWKTKKPILLTPH